MLEVKDLSFSYNKNWDPFFEGLNFSVNKWEILAIFGRSGSGKTSLLQIIASLIKPRSGNILYKWNDVLNSWLTYLYKFRSEKIWFAFQDFKLLEDFTVYENVCIPFMISNNIKDENWLNKIFHTFEINDILDKNIKNISWWEKERVSIAKSFANKPEILLLDEPWTYLNNSLKLKVFDFIKAYSKDNIVVAVSHDDYFIDYFWLDLYESNWNLKFYKNWLNVS